MEAPLTPTEIHEIANRLAWTDGGLDEQVRMEYCLTCDALECAMRLAGYEWDYDLDTWASVRPAWGR